jgi:hypothetical protein
MNSIAMTDEFVTVHNANWLPDALFIKSVLEGDGIEAFVPDEHTVSMDPLLTTALGGIRVMVRASDETRAREMIASAFKNIDDSSTDED